MGRWGLGWGYYGAFVYRMGHTLFVGVNEQLRLWSSANFGQDLIINPSGGQMYYWAVNATPTTFDRAQSYKAGATITTSSGSFTSDAQHPTLVNYVMVSNASDFVFALDVTIHQA